MSGEPQDATFDLHSVDPPEHTRLRDLVTRAFTPGRVTGLEPRVREITDGLLDAMAAGDTADLIGDFAYPLSLTVISELVGVPAPDLDDFRVWVTAALTPRFVRDPLMSREEGGGDCASTSPTWSPPRPRRRGRTRPTCSAPC